MDQQCTESVKQEGGLHELQTLPLVHWRQVRVCLQRQSCAPGEQ
jgi:hypothetical protein